MPMHLRGELDFQTDDERIGFLANLVEEGSQNSTVREFTLNLLNQMKVDSYDRMGEITAIFKFVRDYFSYRNHVFGRDSFTTAQRTLQMYLDTGRGSGDCDQYSVLIASMLMTVGIPAAFRIMTTDPNQSYHHIYPLAGYHLGKNDEKWIPMDATNKSAKLGWEPRYADKRDYKIVIE